MAGLMLLPDGDYALANNEVYTVPIQYEDAAGNVVSPPSGDTITITASGAFAASLTMSIVTTPVVAAVLTPQVVESDAGNSGGGIGFTLKDTAGLMEDSTGTAKFDIVNPALTPTQFGLNFPGVTTTSQATPTNPGP